MVKACEETLNDLVGRLGLSVGTRQVTLCCLHLELVFRWNRRVNLTRIRQEEALSKHLLDSLIPLSVLPEGGWVLDVGSGAGFPGIPLAVCRPGSRVMLLDASRKKTSFLKVAAADLGLSNVRVIHGRLEDFAESHRQEGPAKGFDLITFRAVSPDPERMALLARLARAGSGCIAYWAGAKADPAQAAGWNRQQLERLDDFCYELPNGLGRRRLIRWRVRASRTT
ncbi:16S rRNA m(7)G-527 methyltransferase [Desulfacinum hydrothermale DSM 13146]|uniref:Ribosomal RNA small subunit methyltransferase G n=1 Tax=Desulfacinum hydrothermale DSM 13146 TaxID=1121390 RepID=A0A1W1XJ72_9BACT|nr:16S rRNA (guanine(527)-N(7))-methyltransferase RsmG [Desulfacinum hydrothermale]SMC23571.1 16S rRNA m(7)G-527 methyltransferase [Desulfacinum hydrothermale DSM 13146]